MIRKPFTMKNIFFTLATVLGLIIHCEGQGIVQSVSPDINLPSPKDTTLTNELSNPQPAGNNIFDINYKQKKIRDVPWFVERFKLSAGVFFPSASSHISVGNNSGSIGTDIDFENDLGFNKSSSSFYADLQWRASSLSRFDLSYYGLNRSSNYTLQKDIMFGDNTYNVNATVNAFFNTNIYRFSYGYAIFSKPTWEAGLLFGAHIVRFNVGLSANSNGNTVAVSNDFGFTAPLPDFGVWGGVTLGPKWALNGEFDYLALTVDGITGKILAYNFSATFKPFKNLSFAAGYTGLNFTVNAVRDRLDGHLKWGYNGPTITAAFSFGHKAWE